MDAERSIGGQVLGGNMMGVFKVPDPTREWELTESDKRLLISVADKWVMIVLNDVAVRQESSTKLLTSESI